MYIQLAIEMRDKRWRSVKDKVEFYYVRTYMQLAIRDSKVCIYS